MGERTPPRLAAKGRLELPCRGAYPAPLATPQAAAAAAHIKNAAKPLL